MNGPSPLVPLMFKLYSDEMLVNKGEDLFNVDQLGSLLLKFD